MKVKFIGTGNMQNKNCNACLLIDDILFDIGNGVTHQLDILNIDLSSINYLVITHFHGDHFLDLPNFLYSRLFRNITKEFTIIGPVGLKSKAIELFRFSFGDGVKDYNDICEKYNITFIELNPNDSIYINDKELKAYKLNHAVNKEELGYVYDKKVAYLVDTTIGDNYNEICKNTPYVISDVTDIETNIVHVGLKDYIKIAEMYPNNKFYATHRNTYNTEGIKNIYFPNDNDELNI